MNTCPITQYPFVDPIMAPCCGNSFERDALVEWLENSSECPLCKGSLEHFDAVNAVRNRSIIVEDPVAPLPGLSITSPVVSDYIATTANFGDFNVTKIELKDTVHDDSYVNIIIADSSGSMSGSRWNAVVRGIKFLHTVCPRNNIYVSYDNSARVETYQSITTNFSGGGTNFRAAFGILNTLTVPQNVKTANVIFMTDGEDRADEQLYSMIRETVTSYGRKGIDLIINSVGISSSHTVAPLDSVRKLGTREGIYCYADTDQNGSEDIYNKLSSMTSGALSTKKTVMVQGLDSDLIEVQVNSLIISKVIPKTLLVDSCEVLVADTPCETFVKELYSKCLSEISSAAVSGKYAFPAGTLLMQRYLSLFGDQDQALNEAIKKISEVLKGQTLDTRQMLDLTSGVYSASNVTKNSNANNHNVSASQFVPPKKKSMTGLNGSLGANGYIERIYFGRKDRNINSDGIAVTQGNYLNVQSGNPCDSHGNTPLHLAAHKGHLEAVKYIVNEFGYEDTNNHGYTPFELAASRGHYRCLRVLGPYAGTEELMRSLVFTANKGYRESADIIYALLRDNTNEAPCKDLFYGPGYTWYTNNVVTGPLSIDDIIKMGSTNKLGTIDPAEIQWYHFHEVVNNSSLFIAMADLVQNEILEEFDQGSSGDFGSPIIFLCINKGKMDLVKYLLGRNVDIESLNFKGNTPLCMAAYKRNLDIFCMLLDNGANPLVLNWENEGPLMHACQYGHTDIIQLLLEYGASPTVRNARDESPFSSAVRCNRIDSIKMLLDSGKVAIADILTKAFVDGFDPIMSAIEMDRPEILQVLYNYVAEQDPEIFWSNRTASDNVLCPGGNVFHMAAKYNSWKCIRNFLSKHSENLSFDSQGNTPLHVATIAGSIEALREFKAARWTFEAQNSDGLLPVQLATFGSRAYEFYHDPLFAAVSAVELDESCRLFFELFDGLLFTKQVFGNVLTGLRNNDLETLIHVAAKTNNKNLYAGLMPMFDLDTQDINGMTARKWASVYDLPGSDSEFGESLKKMFKGSLLLLLKANNTANTANTANTVNANSGSKETKLLPAEFSGYHNLKNILTPKQMFDLKNYMIIYGTRFPDLDQKVIMISWFIDAGFSVSLDHNSLLVPLMTVPMAYKFVVGSEIIGTGSSITLSGQIELSTGSANGLDLNQVVAYEITNAKVFKTLTNKYYLPEQELTVHKIHKLTKYSLMQKNIRDTTYQLTRGQVTGLLVELE